MYYKYLGVWTYNFGRTLKIRLSIYCNEVITITVTLNFWWRHCKPRIENHDFLVNVKIHLLKLLGLAGQTHPSISPIGWNIPVVTTCPGFVYSNAVFVLFIASHFLAFNLPLISFFKTCLVFRYNWTKLTIWLYVKKYHKFRLLSIFADGWQAAPLDVRY